MVFSSYIFVFAFLPIVLICYFLLSRVVGKRIQHLFLFIASLFFYAYFNVSYLYIIVVSIVVNYLLAKALSCFQHIRRLCGSQLILFAGILFNLGMIGYFKYYDFFVDNINHVLGTGFTLKNILLPLGISFFTFQQLSFLISVYKEEETIGDFIDYGLFISFFPQLIAGPIVLYKEMMPQFVENTRRYVNYDNISKGIYIFTIGMFKKVVIADTLAVFVSNGFSATELALLPAWIVSISYTLQIYFDFSGYSDMAIGLGKMFNIDIPLNFDSPYKSESITAFWRKWHITLGRFLTTYIYIPLGGNRKGAVRTCVNVLITLLISGLWHGSAWTFVLWGGLNGIVIVFERIFKGFRDELPKALRIATTFLITNVLWVLFRAESFDKALVVYKGMINIWNIGIPSIADIVFDGAVNFPLALDILYVFALLGCLLLIVFFSKSALEKAREFYPTARSMLFVVFLFVVCVIHFSRESIFIYYNF